MAVSAARVVFQKVEVCLSGTCVVGDSYWNSCVFVCSVVFETLVFSTICCI